MNWQQQLAGKIKTAAPVAAPTEHVMVAQLRAAAVLFAKRTDGFAAGKAATCLDIASKLVRFGSFASDAQAGFAAKLVIWAQPREQNAAPASLMALPRLSGVLLRQAKAQFHAGPLKISRAQSGEPICWVIWNGTLVAFIKDGQMFAKRGVTMLDIDRDALLAVLAEFEANPLVTAVKYAKEFGRCCNCGITLTNPKSVALGIGPICRGYY